MGNLTKSLMIRGGAQWSDSTGTALVDPGGRPVGLMPTGDIVSPAVVGQATPWVRLFGPNEFRSAWSGSAEWTTVPTYTTAQSPSGGPCMTLREGAAMRFNMVNATATYGGFRNTSCGLSPTIFQHTTIALLVYVHRIYSASTSINLRIGKDTGNYITYQWRSDTNMLFEGWNMLLVHTDEPIGSSTTTQRSFQAAGVSAPGWQVGLGTFDPNSNASTVNYVQFECYGAGPSAGNSVMQVWVEGMYIGGKDKPKLTIGFDIQTNGLDLAKSTLDAYGFKGYAAVPTGNTLSAYPNFMWDAGDVARLRSLYASGWDIVQHGISHSSMSSVYDDGLIETEYEACRAAILEIGCPAGADLYASPNGSFSNRTIAAAARCGIKWARHVNNAPMFIPSGLVGLVNPLLHGSFAMSNATDAVHTLEFVDALIAYGASSHLYTHSIVSGPSDSVNTNVTVFAAICAGLRSRVDAGLIDVVTPTEFLRKSNSRAIAQSLVNPSRLSLFAPSSPWSLRNQGYRPLKFVVSGGTVSDISYSRDGSTFDNVGSTAGTFDVSPGDMLRITYSAAPTVIQYGL